MTTLDRPALAGEAAACRRLWAAVVLAALNDWWAETTRAKGDPARIAAIRRSALRYFRSRDGREVCTLAGMTADPERLADAAVDLTARERTIKGDA